ncbi:MAG: FxsA family protein [Pseudomonadota bacterium]
MILFLVLVAVPIIEIGLFIEVGGWLGLWPTLGIVILTALIGTMLLRAQGVGVLAELQRKLNSAEDPSSTLAHGAMILVAGVLLLTPGFFTDAVGFLLLMPPVRSFLIARAAHRVIATNIHVQTFGGGMGPHPGQSSRPASGPASGPRRAPDGGTIIEGEFERVDAPDDSAHPQESDTATPR